MDGTMKPSTFLAEVTSILVKKSTLEMTVWETGETKFIEGKVIKIKNFHKGKYLLFIKVQFPPFQVAPVSDKTRA